MMQWIEDLALLQLWRRFQLLLRLDPWSGNFCIAMGAAEKGKKKKKEGKKAKSGWGKSPRPKEPHVQRP